MNPRRIARQKAHHPSRAPATRLGVQRAGSRPAARPAARCRRIPDPDEQLAFGPRDGRQRVQCRLVGPSYVARPTANDPVGVGSVSSVRAPARATPPTRRSRERPAAPIQRSPEQPTGGSRHGEIHVSRISKVLCTAMRSPRCGCKATPVGAGTRTATMIAPRPHSGDVGQHVAHRRCEISVRIGLIVDSASGVPTPRRLPDAPVAKEASAGARPGGRHADASCSGASGSPRLRHPLDRSTMKDLCGPNVMRCGRSGRRVWPPARTWSPLTVGCCITYGVALQPQRGLRIAVQSTLPYSANMNLAMAATPVGCSRASLYWRCWAFSRSARWWGRSGWSTGPS